MFKKKNILVVGDIMLDKYSHGNVSRVSPEAPVPIVDIKKIIYKPGGASNVAQNLSALGMNVTLLGKFVSNIGQNKAGDEVDLLIRPDDIIHDDDSLFSAKVIGKKFRGADFLYELELKDKQKIFCYAPSHHNHEINEVIGITLDLDHLIFFDN